MISDISKTGLGLETSQDQFLSLGLGLEGCGFGLEASGLGLGPSEKHWNQMGTAAGNASIF